jgi:hypothetical protein
MERDYEVRKIENRINLLKERDPVANEKIIKKLRRQLRALEKKI